MNQATIDGTTRYKSRFGGTLADDHFRQARGWWMSSIGLGTYLGEMDEATDHRYETAITAALRSGCNVIDAAINYRFQRSERTLGKALKESGIARDEVIISTKGGFLSFDGDYPTNPARYIREQYIETGIIKEEDMVAGCHSMTPAYLENQLDRSLKNLSVDSVDIYFIHNPETQLSEISRQDFLRRILAAFKLLEKKVAEGKIQIYGAATWDGFRVSPQKKSYLSLEELIGLARDAGGEEHHFRALQLPFNLAMPEAFLSKNQKLGSVSVSLLEAAEKQNMVVLSSASILQGQLAANLPAGVVDFFPDFDSDAQRSIQFARSTPGISTALVGMSQIEHVEENLKVAKHPPLSWEKLKAIFA